MKRTVIITAILLGGLSFSVLAQDHNYYELPPVQPLQPLMPTYQLPTMPIIPAPSHTYRPDVPTYQPPPQRDWRDMVDDAMRDFRSHPPGHTPESYQMMLDRQDRAMQRNHYANCAKYNRFCANMLRSLGD